MIRSIEIRNFRCFRALSIQGLKRFNIMVGDSGTGKTAFMEAVFLVASASPSQWLRLRQWRGLGASLRLTGTKFSYDSLFGDLFFDFQSDKGASINLIDDSPGMGQRSLHVKYPRQATLKLPSGEKIENAFMVDPISFDWNMRGKGFKTRVTVSPRDGSLDISAARDVYPAYFSSPMTAGRPRYRPVVFSIKSEKSRRPNFDVAVRSIFRRYRRVEP